MRPDHLGDHLYGYNGIAYFNDLDLDDHYRSKGIDKSEIIWRERD